MPIQQMLVGIGTGEKFAEATGGTVTTVGDYKVHAFTSSGTFTVTQIGDVNEFEALIVAGGAGPCIFVWFMSFVMFDLLRAGSTLLRLRISFLP